MKPTRATVALLLTLLVCTMTSLAARAAGVPVAEATSDPPITKPRIEFAGPHEDLAGPPMPRPDGLPPGAIAGGGPVIRDQFVSIQANVDQDGNNIPGDAANEPSIAIDPNNPANLAIGWRQFNTRSSSFRQAGRAYSRDGGLTWTFPGVLRPGEFSSDPVLAAGPDGTFYYYALQPDRGPGGWACYMYRSFDGGITWPQETYAYGGDKAWFAIDSTGGQGHGNIYVAWNPNASCCSGIFNRSLDGGNSFSVPRSLPLNVWAGSVAVGPDGELYIIGATNSGTPYLIKSASPYTSPVVFEPERLIDLGGVRAVGGGPNPGGLLG